MIKIVLQFFKAYFSHYKLMLHNLTLVRLKIRSQVINKDSRHYKAPAIFVQKSIYILDAHILAKTINLFVP